MPWIFCPQCRLEQPTEHRYCVRCATRLPVDLVTDAPKRARWFAGVKVAEGDPEPGFLRVSCYLSEQTFEDDRGSSVVIPGRHVRFSVWDGEHAKCVVSLPEAEARELAAFVEGELSAADTRLVPDGGPEWTTLEPGLSEGG